MDLLSQAQAVLASQPFSVLVGAQLTRFAEGMAEIQIRITDQLRQQHGFVHGGVFSYAADNAITFAGGSVLGPSVVASQITINYLNPAAQGVLAARATVIHSSRSHVVCRCDVFALSEQDEQLCAIAQGIVTMAPQARTPGP